MAPSDGPSSRSVRRLDLGAVGVGDPRTAPVHADDHASPAEAHLQPPVLAAGERAGGGFHRTGVAGERRAVGGRVGAAQDPVVAGADEHVAALGPPPAQPDDHLPRVPLLGLVGAAVPDRHAAAAVLTGRDVAGELQVLDRVVLGAHGQPHGVRLGGQAFGHRPRRRTPSRSSRTSQCRLRAWCSWMTKRSSAAGTGSAAGMGSGVRAASRLRRYSSSGTASQ